MDESLEGACDRSLPLLDHLARVGRRAAEVSMSPGGLRPRHLHALGILNERGSFTQQSLGEVLSLDPSNVVGLLNELEARGLVIRRRDPADRRRHIVEISAAGEGELAAAYLRLALVEEELLAALNVEERATLHQLLVRAAGTASPPCATGTDTTTSEMLTIPDATRDVMKS
jgi:DNA-binding MarR family transcriptional regulator